MEIESEYERRMLLWRDYFALLQQGVEDHTTRSGIESHELKVWLDVIQTEIVSDVMHRRQGQPQFCRWTTRPKDLSSDRHNIESRSDDNA